MKRVRGVAAATLLATVVVVGVVVAVRDSGSSPATTERAGAEAVEVRGCQQRVEGGRLSPVRARDTIIGPLAFLALPETYRMNRSRSGAELEPYPGVGMPAMKIIALLRTGQRVTIAVPREQRRWMKLLYEHAARRGEYGRPCMFRG